MRLAIIGIRGIPANFPGSSGIDTYVENQLAILAKQFYITLFPRSWVKHKKTVYQQIPVPCLHDSYFDTGLYTILATFYALSQNSDIFWYHASGSALFSFIPRLLGKKVILTIHGVDWQRTKWANPIFKNIIRLLEIIAVHSSTEIHVVSQDLINYIASTYHRNVIFSPPQVSVQTTSRYDQLSQWHLVPNQYILYLGRLVPEKRVDWLISAFKKTPHTSDLKLVVAGYIEHTHYCQQLLSQSNPNIIFTDYVSGQHKWQLLNYCRLFVLPSLLEGNSLALQEVVALHKKCLISDITPHRQIIPSSKNITLFKTNSFQDFYQKLTAHLQGI